MLRKVLLGVLTIAALAWSQPPIGSISGNILGPVASGLKFKINFKGNTYTGSLISSDYGGLTTGYQFVQNFLHIWRGTTSIEAITPGYIFSPESFYDTLGRLGNNSEQLNITHTFRARDTAKPTITNIKITPLTIKLGDSITLKYTQLDNSNRIGSRKIYIGNTAWTLIDSTIKNISDNIADINAPNSNRTLKFAPPAGTYKIKIVMGDKDSNFTTAYSDSFKVVAPTAIKNISLNRNTPKIEIPKIYNFKGQILGRNDQKLPLGVYIKSQKLLWNPQHR